MRRAVLLAVGVLAVWASAAQAHTTIIEPPESRDPYQRWIDEAKVPTPDITLTVEETPDAPAICGRHPGCTFAATSRIVLETGFAFQKQVFYHEMGHQVDDHVLPEWMRGRFESILGLTRWAPEMFANTWAECARDPRAPADERQGPPRYWVWYATGGSRRFNTICRMLKKVPG